MQSTSFLREASILGIFSFWKVESDQGGVVPPPPRYWSPRSKRKWWHYVSSLHLQVLPQSLSCLTLETTYVVNKALDFRSDLPPPLKVKILRLREVRGLPRPRSRRLGKGVRRVGIRT